MLCYPYTGIFFTDPEANRCLHDRNSDHTPVNSLTRWWAHIQLIAYVEGGEQTIKGRRKLSR